jgi:heat shock protein HtpX
MTIYSQVNSNKFKTYLIIFFFILFISFFFYVVGLYYGNSNGYFIFGILFSLISGIGSYYYSDKIVLAMSGAKPADKKTYFNFYTSAENMAIAAGIPMPKLYVIEDDAPNAFATGRNPEHSVVAATTGLLKKLNRSEIEAVIAHEMSHVKNYDILLMSIVSVLVGMLMFVVDWVSRSMFWGRNRDDDNRDTGVITLIIFLATLILTPLIATLIQMAISRKREYLADASGALLTRRPDALASALEKISADREVLKNASNGMAHMYIENPYQKKSKFTNWISGLFSTHPPVGERIRLLREM